VQSELVKAWKICRRHAVPTELLADAVYAEESFRKGEFQISAAETLCSCRSLQRYVMIDDIVASVMNRI
jgi:hypothetical protein